MTVRSWAAAAMIAMAALGVGACSSSDTGKTVNVAAADFSLKPDVSSVVAGKVSFKVHNVGGFGHEMVVVRAADAKDLPTKPDGEVDESAIAAGSLIGEVTGVLPGQTKTLTVTLEPGKYVLFCNLVDGTNAVHFKRGMHTDFMAGARL